MKKETIREFNQLLKDRKLHICFAESMTAGLLSATVASVEGASSVLKGGIVCYDKLLKTGLLGVKEETLNQFGAESAETTREMAEGLESKNTGAEIVVAITGSASLPVNEYVISSPAGYVFVCIGFQQNYHSFEVKLNGNRQEVLQQAVEFVFREVRKVVEDVGIS